jgi:hypothetical protein
MVAISLFINLSNVQDRCPDLESKDSPLVKIRAFRANLGHRSLPFYQAISTITWRMTESSSIDHRRSGKS